MDGYHVLLPNGGEISVQDEALPHAVINSMKFAFGIFIIKLIQKDFLSQKDANEIIDKLNAADTEDAVLAATVGEKNSIWNRLFVSDNGELLISDGTNVDKKTV
jgi:hypothetical protein